jgi:uncharacterized protein (DUF302 family)
MRNDEDPHMSAIEIMVERFTMLSSKSFDDTLSKLQAAVGHPDMSAFSRDLASAKDEAALENIVNKAVGPTGLMQFHLFNLGDVLQKELGPQARKSVRLLIGNPHIMKEMVKHVPDAGSYAPVTILVDERVDGVHLTYDTMTSYLKPYGNPAALKVARDLDTKVQALLATAAH